MSKFLSKRKKSYCQFPFNFYFIDKLTHFFLFKFNRNTTKIKNKTKINKKMSRRNSREFLEVYAASSQQTAIRLEGKGIKIGTSKKLVTKLDDLTEDELGKLHRLLYKENGVKADRKQNVLAFCGLEQANVNFEKEKVRITKNLQKKLPAEREKLKDVFYLKSAEVEDILAFIIEPFRPKDDEEI